MRHIAFFFLFTLISNNSLAAEGQVFFQPTKNQNVFSPALSTTIIRVTTPDTTFPEFEDTTDIKSVSATLEYEYGLLENLSLGIRQSYSYSDITFESQSTHFKGLNDLLLYSKGFSRLNETWTLRYGIGGSLSLENSTADNQYTGRNQIIPYLGFDTFLNKTHRIGGRVSYSFLVGKSKFESSTGTVTETTGGENLSVSGVYEFNWKNGLVGAAPTYTTVLGTKSGGTTTDTQRYFGTSFFANFYLNDSITLIPMIGSSILLNDELNGTKINSYAGFSTSISARFNF